MTDAEKAAALTDALKRIVAAAGKGLSDQMLASVAVSYAHHALQLVGEIPHAPLSEEALAYARDVVAPRIAERMRTE